VVHSVSREMKGLLVHEDAYGATMGLVNITGELLPYLRSYPITLMPAATGSPHVC